MKGTNEGMWTRIWDRGREHAKSRGKRDQRVVGWGYDSENSIDFEGLVN